jgi:hypothetical protein
MKLPAIHLAPFFALLCFAFFSWVGDLYLFLLAYIYLYQKKKEKKNVLLLFLAAMQGDREILIFVFPLFFQCVLILTNFPVANFWV